MTLSREHMTTCPQWCGTPLGGPNSRSEAERSIFDRSNRMTRIRTLYAYFANGDGGGLAAVHLDGTWYPLVCETQHGLKRLQPLAAMVARQTGQSLTLVQFSESTNVETVKPPEADEDHTLLDPTKIEAS